MHITLYYIILYIFVIYYAHTKHVICASGISPAAIAAGLQRLSGPPSYTPNPGHSEIPPPASEGGGQIQPGLGGYATLVAALDSVGVSPGQGRLPLSPATVVYLPQVQPGVQDTDGQWVAGGPTPKTLPIFPDAAIFWSVFRSAPMTPKGLFLPNSGNGLCHSGGGVSFLI